MKNGKISFTATVRKVGDSKVITIKSIKAKSLDLEVGDEVKVIIIPSFKDECEK